MRRYEVSGVLKENRPHMDNRSIHFFFYAKNRTEAEKQIKDYNWLHWQAEELHRCPKCQEFSFIHLKQDGRLMRKICKNCGFGKPK